MLYIVKPTHQSVCREFLWSVEVIPATDQTTSLFNFTPLKRDVNYPDWRPRLTNFSARLAAHDDMCAVGIL